MSSLFNSVKVNGLPLFWERVAISAVILLFVKICLPIFLFDVWDKLWVRIRSVPEVYSII